MYLSSSVSHWTQSWPMFREVHPLKFVQRILFTFEPNYKRIRYNILGLQSSSHPCHKLPRKDVSLIQDKNLDFFEFENAKFEGLIKNFAWGSDDDISNLWILWDYLTLSRLGLWRLMHHSWHKLHFYKKNQTFSTKPLRITFLKQ